MSWTPDWELKVREQSPPGALLTRWQRPSYLTRAQLFAVFEPFLLTVSLGLC